MFEDTFDPYDKLLELESYIEHQAFAIESLNRQMNDLRRIVDNYAKYNQKAVIAIENLYTYTTILDKQLEELKNEKTTGRATR
jgi:hypothetical protein